MTLERFEFYLLSTTTVLVLSYDDNNWQDWKERERWWGDRVCIRTTIEERESEGEIELERRLKREIWEGGRVSVSERRLTRERDEWMLNEKKFGRSWTTD